MDYIERIDMTKTNYNIIDLFCGCGGFSKGFEQAGFNVKLGVDMWKDATVTYQHNFPDADIINEDITNVSGEQILQKLNLNAEDIDVIIGGPPCQGFSVSGKRMKDDPRNQLYKSFVEIVEYVKPKIFVMENVPGLIRLFGGKVKEEVIYDFSSLGYEVSCETLSADNYGVPQQRKRVFFVGLNKEKIKNTSTFEFPKAKNGKGEDEIPFVTCEDAISDLDFIPDDVAMPNEIPYSKPAVSDYQRLMRKDSNVIFNHVTTLHNQKTKDIISLVPDGSNYKSLPDSLKETRKVNIAWTRMNSKKPCFTIDTGHNHHFHYKENRVPTARESARIQSFPDNFEFLGKKTSQLKQVGNAVPPLLSQALAEQIKELLNKEQED